MISIRMSPIFCRTSVVFCRGGKPSSNCSSSRFTNVDEYERGLSSMTAPFPYRFEAGILLKYARNLLCNTRVPLHVLIAIHDCGENLFCLDKYREICMQRKHDHYSQSKNGCSYGTVLLCSLHTISDDLVFLTPLHNIGFSMSD